jgi:hypothetical protein
MIDRNELVRKIVQAVITEEDAIQLYSRHLKVVLPWSGLKKKQRLEVEKSLTILAADSQKHREILTAVKERIMEGDGDVH